MIKDNTIKKIMDTTTLPEHDSENNSGKNSTKEFWKELLKLLIIAAVIVVPFRLYVAQPFIVDGASMDPTFRTGQYLIVDELTYHFKAPARGSVLIFKFPKDESKYFIKRVIGLPGETVAIKNGVVSIVNADHPKGMALDEPYVELPKDDTETYTLGQGEYYVMGDNRFASADSRLWGPVPAKDIIGRPILRLLPFAIWPGDKTKEDSI
ncbi:MAG: signal peptidase signal peptidase [Parcubacteria group bacterium]|nr:signal peptidase signal peptidase [Parcubacteria group bacterium]